MATVLYRHDSTADVPNRVGKKSHGAEVKMRYRTIAVVFLVLGLGLSGCGQAPSQPAALPTSAPPQELVLYTWTQDYLHFVGELFSAETGIPVRVEAYESQEEAIDLIRGGEVFDVVVMENQLVPTMIEEGLLHPLNLGNITNFRNVSLGFRDLAHDPGNRYSMPYSWGSSGLLVRTDLIDRPVTAWADLWDPEYAGRVIVWSSVPRYMVGIALKSLGYSANSEDPAELHAARDKLIELKSRGVWLHEEETSVPALVDSGAVFAVAWAYDVEVARDEGIASEYIMPVEGSILWSDSFVIPANSSNPLIAEQFLDFVLRADVSAKLIEEGYYPTANDAAKALLDPEILQDPIIFPTAEQLQRADILMPLSKAGQELHDAVWAEFLAAPGAED